jgi:hypothetical protein
MKRAPRRVQKQFKKPLQKQTLAKTSTATLMQINQPAEKYSMLPPARADEFAPAQGSSR